MSQGQQPDNTSGMMLAMAAALIALFAIKYFYGTAIGHAYMSVKHLELRLMWWLAGHFEAGQITMHFLENVGLPKPKAVNLQQYKDIGANVGKFTNLIFAPVFGWFAWRVWRDTPVQKFRRQMDMGKLSASEQRLWGSIAPVVGLNIIEMDISKGKWAMSPKPLDFARRYKLLDEDNMLDMERAEKLFASQLGRLWEGPEKLPRYARALFAAFAAFGSGDPKEKEAAQAALDDYSRSVAAGKPDDAWVKPMLERHLRNPEVQKIIAGHAYVYTAMASMLEYARGMGPLASANFIWLKPMNRAMWYTLNGVGRRVAFAEVAGIFAHWGAERLAGHPIERPYVSKAVEGLKRHFETEVKIV